MWLKESNRQKHLLYAIPIGLVFTILAVLGCAFGMEFKDKEYGDKFDQLDIAATMIGGAIGQLLQIIIMKEFLRLMITSHSGISSKRVCGVIGFLIIIFVLVYCTISSIQAPLMIEPFIYAVCLLLGIDSVTGIWKGKMND